MPKLPFILLFLVLTTTLVLAQEEAPKAEIFGGYSFASADFSGAQQDRASLNGWEASVTGNVNRWLGIKADLSGHYGSPNFRIPVLGISLPGFSVNNTDYEFLFGPQLSYRTAKVTPFAHALFGAAHVSEGFSLLGFGLPLSSLGLAPTDTAFATALGGGLDYNFSPHFAWRGQGDYLMTRLFNSHQNNFRVSTGLVFRF